MSRPITSSDFGLDPAEKENAIRCRRCENFKPLQDFAKNKSRGRNGLDNIDANGLPDIWKECNKCRAKRRDSQAKANAARRASNEKVKSQSHEFFTWGETLRMIDAGFAPIIAEF